MNSVTGYIVDLDSVSWQESFRDIFPILSFERQKQLNLLYERGRKDALLQSLAAGLLIHYLLGEYFQWKGTYQITKNIYGKPIILGLKGDFNLTHAHNWVMIAGSAVPIGIDLEWEGRTLRYRDVADRFFHPKEIQQLNRSTIDLKKQFFQFWTLKESFIKALGRGLSVPLNSFEIFHDNMGYFRVKKKGLSTSWHLKSEYNNGYYLGICTQEHSNLSLKRVAFEHLINYVLK